jgi:hypothetical protein
VDAEEGFLIDIAGVFFRVKEIVSHAQDVMVVGAHKLIKSAGIAALGGTDKVVFGGTL